MEIKKRNLLISVLSLLALLYLMLYSVSVFSMEWIASLMVLIVIAGIFYYRKDVGKKDVYLILLLFFVFSIALSFYYFPSSYIAQTQGTVLSPNWWSALNWIKNNTAECAVVATYWDPGHFITAIARRPVIFDGASQSELFTREKDGVNVTTSRIKDVATVLFTSDEDEAIEILKDYIMTDCDEMYFLASADLIQKAHWWTYFSTWDPANKGTAYNYIIVSLTDSRPILEENAIFYEYAFAQQQSFVLYETNASFKPYMQQAGQFFTVEKLFYFTRDGSRVMYSDPEAEIKGLLWLEPTRQTMVYIPPELEESLFTKMFFFEGIGLSDFEFVNNWGGEVKLYKVHFD